MEYVVVDEDAIALGQGDGAIKGRFATEEEASAFIATLPDYALGRYGIDGPEEY